MNFQETPWVATYSGRQVSLDCPTREDIALIDIAVGLSNQCRWTGQCWPFYSIAEHSVIVSNEIEARWETLKSSTFLDMRQACLIGLIHDAPEAWLNDLIRPVKRLINGYENLEVLFANAVKDKFNLQYDDQDYKVIKQIDDLMTITERLRLFPNLDPATYTRDVDLSLLPDASVIRCVNPQEAVYQFIHRFAELAGLSRQDYIDYNNFAKRT